MMITFEGCPNRLSIAQSYLIFEFRLFAGMIFNFFQGSGVPPHGRAANLHSGQEFQHSDKKISKYFVHKYRKDGMEMDAKANTAQATSSCRG